MAECGAGRECGAVQVGVDRTVRRGFWTGAGEGWGASELATDRTPLAFCAGRIGKQFVSETRTCHGVSPIRQRLSASRGPWEPQRARTSSPSASHTKRPRHIAPRVHSVSHLRLRFLQASVHRPKRPTMSSQPNTSLYVKNLNDKVKKDELRTQLFALFTTYGRIIDVVALKGQKMKGQAFVVFTDLAGATAAMRGCEGMVFYDKPMVRHPSQAPLMSFPLMPTPLDAATAH